MSLYSIMLSMFQFLNDSSIAGDIKNFSNKDSFEASLPFARVYAEDEHMDWF